MENKIETKMKKNQLGSLTRAGLIVNVVFCILGIIGYLGAVLVITMGIIGAKSVIDGTEVIKDLTPEQAPILISGFVIVLLIVLVLWAISIFSLIVSARVLKGKSSKITLAGVLAIFSGGLIAGILILVGNSNDKQNNPDDIISE